MESNYEQLVKALRCCSKDKCGQCEYEWNPNREFCMNSMCADAAAAIEALQAEVEELKRVNVELFEDLPKYGDYIQHWVSVDERLPEPYIQCLVRDNDCNCAVGYYRQDAKAWDSPFFGWVERDDEYYKDGDLCRIGKVVAWMPIEPPKGVCNAD